MWKCTNRFSQALKGMLGTQTCMWWKGILIYAKAAMRCTLALFKNLQNILDHSKEEGLFRSSVWCVACLSGFQTEHKQIRVNGYERHAKSAITPWGVDGDCRDLTLKTTRCLQTNKTGTKLLSLGHQISFLHKITCDCRLQKTYVNLSNKYDLQQQSELYTCTCLNSTAVRNPFTHSLFWLCVCSQIHTPNCSSVCHLIPELNLWKIFMWKL